MNLKKSGVSKGYPDIEIPYPCNRFHGFFLEFKPINGGKLTHEQLDWLTYLRSVGYYAEMTHGFEEAKEHFLLYLKSHKDV